MGHHEEDGRQRLAIPVNADDEDLLERGRLLFARPCRFVLGAAKLEQVPESDLPEVAFAGRSNVGKSSLVNALTGRSALARTSNTPGRTQQLNFFDLDGRLMIADLPGYGFAKAPKDQVERWTRLVDAYLKGRAQLRRTCLLVDARHGLKDVDRRVMDMLDAAAVSYQVVLTKCDKVKKIGAVIETVAKELATHVAAHPDIIPISSKTGVGVAKLQAELASFHIE